MTLNSSPHTRTSQQVTADEQTASIQRLPRTMLGGLLLASLRSTVRELCWTSASLRGADFRFGSGGAREVPVDQISESPDGPLPLPPRAIEADPDEPT